MIELRVGAPGWYLPAGLAIFLTVIGALLVTPLRWPCMLATVLFAVAVAGRMFIDERSRATFDRLLIYPDFTLVLFDRDGHEFPVEACGQSWVTSALVVFCIRLPTGSKLRLMISPALNSEDAFRRFRVLCRFGLDAGTAGEAYTGPRSSQM